MSKPRSVSVYVAFPQKKDADGKPLCRWCQGQLPKGRTAYCGKQCDLEVSIRTSASSLRYHVKQRDHGVCAGCGLDTQKLKRIFDHAQRSFYEHLEGIGSTAGCWFPGQAREVFRVLIGIGFNYDKTFWEADHILEFSAGGDSSLDNTQTLCVPCHKAKTKKMHADRKFERTGIRPKLAVKETQISLI